MTIIKTKEEEDRGTKQIAAGETISKIEMIVMKKSVKNLHKLLYRLQGLVREGEW